MYEKKLWNIMKNIQHSDWPVDVHKLVRFDQEETQLSVPEHGKSYKRSHMTVIYTRCCIANAFISCKIGDQMLTQNDVMNLALNITDKVIKDIANKTSDQYQTMWKKRLTESALRI